MQTAISSRTTALPEQEVCVLIPVYKAEPSPVERASFLQCLRILGHYPLALVAPEGLDISSYARMADQSVNSIAKPGAQPHPVRPLPQHILTLTCLSTRHMAGRNYSQTQ